MLSFSSTKLEQNPNPVQFALTLGKLFFFKNYTPIPSLWVLSFALEFPTSLSMRKSTPNAGDQFEALHSQTVQD